MALDISGKTALITGAGSGIGLEFTNLLLQRKCNVLAVDINLTAEAGELFGKHSKGSGSARVAYHKADVTNWSQMRGAFDKAVSEFGDLHIVCPGAGVFEPVGSSGVLRSSLIQPRNGPISGIPPQVATLMRAILSNAWT
jgi:NAD(P)-dependent dehydrogenase (short-subunit alcohol dehydrogenase family)